MQAAHDKNMISIMEGWFFLKNVLMIKCQTKMGNWTWETEKNNWKTIPGFPVRRAA